MRKEYDIESLNPRKAPYASQVKQQITIGPDSSTIEYKALADSSEPPSLAMSNLYPGDCAED